MREALFWGALGLSIAVGLTSLAEATGMSNSLNTTLVALSLLVVAGLELVDLYPWTALAQAICGFWLAVSPFVLGYASSGQIGTWHFLLGLLIALIGIWHLTQAWGRAVAKKHERK